MNVGDLMAESGVAFGTSGARGTVVAMTDRVCHGYSVGFLRYLESIGEFHPGDRVALAGDLRPSTPRILQACATAVRDLGGEPIFCGLVPTPTLALHAFAERMPSLMVTGSHIPADRNGIKFYRPHSELLKSDEAPMMEQLVTVEGRAFDGDSLKAPVDLATSTAAIESAFLARYVEAFGPRALAGKAIGVYQHSAVGRDLVVAILEALGATVTPLGRSEQFVPVDTEAIRDEDVALARGWAAEFGFDATVSTDGDSDRPLLADERGEWLRGDVLGVICARHLRAERVITPVSSNTMLEKCGDFPVTSRTRIGSPYVIEEMNAQVASGGERVCGYEANGGFLLASDFVLREGPIAALPTRDAVLPVVAALVEAGAGPLSEVVAALPQRVTYSARIAGLPTASSHAFLAELTAGDVIQQLARIEALFGHIAGKPESLDTTDGLRIAFTSGTIMHLRPSGNAPELRCYTEAATAEVAKSLNEQALAKVGERVPTQ